MLKPLRSNSSFVNSLLLIITCACFLWDLAQVVGEMAPKYHCKECGSRTGRADGSCPQASCSEYRPRSRKLGFGKEVVEKWQKWSTPKRSPLTAKSPPVEQIRKRRMQEGPEQAALLQPAALEPEVVEEGIPVLLPERACRYHCSLLHDVSQSSQATFEGAVRNALKAGGPALAEAVGEPRALQMLASICSLLEYFPQTVRSKMGPKAEVVELFHLALLRVSYKLVMDDVQPSLKWLELSKWDGTVESEGRLHRAEATIMGWVGAAK